MDFRLPSRLIWFCSALRSVFQTLGGFEAYNSTLLSFLLFKFSSLMFYSIFFENSSFFIKNINFLSFYEPHKHFSSFPRFSLKVFSCGNWVAFLLRKIALGSSPSIFSLRYCWNISTVMQTCPFYIQTCSAQLFNELKVSSKNETFKSFYNSKISPGADGNVWHAVKNEMVISVRLRFDNLIW